MTKYIFIKQRRKQQRYHQIWMWILYTQYSRIRSHANIHGYTGHVELNAASSYDMYIHLENITSFWWLDVSQNQW